MIAVLLFSVNIKKEKLLNPIEVSEIQRLSTNFLSPG